MSIWFTFFFVLNSCKRSGQLCLQCTCQQGELAMTINIGEECAHNEIQLLYTSLILFLPLLVYSYKRMSGIWFQPQSKDVRRSGSCLASWALWFSLSSNQIASLSQIMKLTMSFKKYTRRFFRKIYHFFLLQLLFVLQMNIFSCARLEKLRAHLNSCSYRMFSS